ncbi:hypothetical protein TRFO_39545 [Tritrichomonas foetus]|uniref:Uncharacterized protein n=1 Tax=Tritrichomonas foetus TaxID=1144522 RepID=A0A1J4J4G1_9EUKA|nr:hypothetical protein TRFO_39545 [Tritrichomonas foetus]|eukprot:OHS94256.1 hypothetical protein TRFO_39545 [Tritrichomonas foetus]
MIHLSLIHLHSKNRLVVIHSFLMARHPRHHHIESYCLNRLLCSHSCLCFWFSFHLFPYCSIDQKLPGYFFLPSCFYV